MGWNWLSRPSTLHSTRHKWDLSHLTTGGLQVLAGRNIIVYHGKTPTEGTQDRGCPQGGVLSPLLWCLIENQLLQNLQREGFHVYGYTDDMAIMAGGHFLTTLRDLMEHALKMICRWCKTKSLVVNLQNTNIIIFTKRYKPETIEPLRLEGQELAFTNTVKYLRVFTPTNAQLFLLYTLRLHVSTFIGHHQGTMEYQRL